MVLNATSISPSDAWMRIGCPTETLPQFSPEAELLAAAASLVADKGFAGLTLRPLAAALGTSVSALTHRYGARDGVLTQILMAAAVEDRRHLAVWKALQSRIEFGDRLALADLAETVLEDCALSQRELSVLFLECVQAAGWDPGLGRALTPWREVRAEFWNGLARQAKVPEDVIGSGVIEGYFVDELAYSISLSRLPAYRALRRLCLRRLFTNLLPGSAVTRRDAALAEALYEMLGQNAAAPSVVHGAPLPQDWRFAAARCCAVLLTGQGVASVTHRSVAALAGVKPTTLAYRYPTQEDLVIAGLEYIISHLLTSVETVEATRPGTWIDPDPLEGLDVGRATFAVAVAAIRAPRLAPCAADMRRRRGINLIRILKTRSADYSRMDRLSAQTLAVGMIGAAMLAPKFQTLHLPMDRLVEPARLWMMRDEDD